LATERIIVAGLQRDVRPFFDSIRPSVAALRLGAGVKGRINQSMAFLPVVATSVAVDGTELHEREEILVADEPDDFARALIRLYESEALWNRLSENDIRKLARFLFNRRHAQKAGVPTQRPSLRKPPAIRDSSAARYCAGNDELILVSTSEQDDTHRRDHRKSQRKPESYLFRARQRGHFMGNE
jgi:Glycosyl transferases group 1